MSGNITGSVQVKKGYYYAVLNLIGPNGKPKQRWIATGLTEKGNKRKAVQRMKEIIAELCFSSTRRWLPSNGSKAVTG